MEMLILILSGLSLFIGIVALLIGSFGLNPLARCVLPDSCSWHD